MHTLSAFLEDSEQQAHECDPIDSSFHRLIVHKAAEVCALEHKVESNTKDQKVIVLRKGTTTLATAQVLADLVTATTDTSTVVPKRKVKIMRRGNSSSSAAGDNDDKTGSGGDQSGSKQMSLEEREEEYKKARARIFAGDTTPDEIPTSTSRNSSGGGKQGSNRNSYDASTNRRYNQSYYQRDRTSPQPYQPYYPQYYPPQQYYPQQTLQVRDAFGVPSALFDLMMSRHVSPDTVTFLDNRVQQCAIRNAIRTSTICCFHCYLQPNLVSSRIILCRCLNRHLLLFVIMQCRLPFSVVHPSVGM